MVSSARILAWGSSRFKHLTPSGSLSTFAKPTWSNDNATFTVNEKLPHAEAITGQIDALEAVASAAAVSWHMVVPAWWAMWALTINPVLDESSWFVAWPSRVGGLQQLEKQINARIQRRVARDSPCRHAVRGTLVQLPSTSRQQAQVTLRPFPILLFRAMREACSGKKGWRRQNGCGSKTHSSRSALCTVLYVGVLLHMQWLGWVGMWWFGISPIHHAPCNDSSWGCHIKDCQRI